MKQNKMLSLIGLAMKAGKVASGEFATEKTVRSGRADLVLVAQDASENTKKKFVNMCTYYKVPVYFYSDKEALGTAIGRQYRASMAVTDENFAKAITKEMKVAAGKGMVSAAGIENESGGSKYGKSEGQ